ncbi:hypothetical protein Fcan01_16138 [Folsomia candida]|uniref:Uncharacterized protein n=1 Tax=Folsomia candida TaxID=158441 RepID=A0A226DTF7_FOLCA|nr:hypothetical protein Fcan01_16138 [Folsomia candida]
MTYLIRVSNITRGKKIIVSTDNYQEFLIEVKLEFKLDEESEISLQDDHGAEISEKVFCFFVKQQATPNIEFLVKGEIQTELTVNPESNSPIVHLSQQYAQPSGSLPYSLDANYFTQILEFTVDNSPDLKQVVADCNRKGCVDQSASAILINAFVAKLVEVKGETPSSADQKLLAKAIVTILPCWCKEQVYFVKVIVAHRVQHNQGEAVTAVHDSNGGTVEDGRGSILCYCRKVQPSLISPPNYYAHTTTTTTIVSSSSSPTSLQSTPHKRNFTLVPTAASPCQKERRTPHPLTQLAPSSRLQCDEVSQRQKRPIPSLPPIFTTSV